MLSVCAVRRIMNRCEKRCCVLTHLPTEDWGSVFDTPFYECALLLGEAVGFPYFSDS